MAEWTIAAVSKTVIPLRGSKVRILLPPRYTTAGAESRSANHQGWREVPKARSFRLLPPPLIPIRTLVPLVQEGQGLHFSVRHIVWHEPRLALRGAAGPEAISLNTTGSFLAARMYSSAMMAATTSSSFWTAGFSGQPSNSCRVLLAGSLTFWLMVSNARLRTARFYGFEGIY